MEIIKKLDVDNDLDFSPNGSLVHANNIVINNNNNSIQNENAIVEHFRLENEIIVGYITCSNEFVIFTNKNNIYRYNEKTEKYNKVETNWKWGGGKVFGDYTYNVNNELIIAISERDTTNKIPLKTINLNKPAYDPEGNEDKYTLNPNIPIFNLKNHSFNKTGYIYNGVYNFFIRFFINDTDYTPWLKLGYPINVYTDPEFDEIENMNFAGVEHLSTAIRTVKFNTRFGDYYSKDNDKSPKNIQLFLDIFDNTNNYVSYQIGYVITTLKHETITYVETKSNIDNRVYNITNKQDDKYRASLDDLTATFFNIYNVKTLCNYNNRLYVANYIEENPNKLVEKIDTSGIQVKFVKENNIDRLAIGYNDVIGNGDNENINAPRTRTTNTTSNNDVTKPEIISYPVKDVSKAAPVTVSYVWNNPNIPNTKRDFQLNEEYKIYINSVGYSVNVYYINCRIYEVGIYNKKQINPNSIGVDKSFALLIPLKNYYVSRGIYETNIDHIKVQTEQTGGTIISQGNIKHYYLAFVKNKYGRIEISYDREGVYGYKPILLKITDFNNLKNTEIIYDSNENQTPPYINQYDINDNRLGLGRKVTEYINVFNIATVSNSIDNSYRRTPDKKYAITNAVYNFYIHYVYPNGSYTDGIRINNNADYYQNIVIGKNKNSGNIITYDCDLNTTVEDIKKFYYSLGSDIIPSDRDHEVVSLFIEEQVQDVYFVNIFPYDDYGNNISPYRNRNGETFFRPIFGSYNNKTSNIQYGKFVFYNIPMYPEFIGYFISYEETESILTGRGLIGDIAHETFDLPANAFNVYYHDFTSHGVTSFNYLVVGENFQYNCKYSKELKIYGIEYFGGYPLVTDNSNTYVDKAPGIYSLKSKKVYKPGDNGNGSPARIEIELYKDIILNPMQSGDNNDFQKSIERKRTCLLFNYTNDIYTKSNKKLIPLGQIVYEQYIPNKQEGYIYGNTDSNYNYDYYIYDRMQKTYFKTELFKNLYQFNYPIYTITENNGLLLSDGTPYPIKPLGGTFYPDLPINNWTTRREQANDYHITHVAIPFVSKYLYHARTLKTKPIIRNFTYNRMDGTNVAWSQNFTNKNIVPDRIDDLFGYNSCFINFSDKLFINFNKDTYSNYIEEYKKTIRRSDVISDESVDNKWKIFRPEQYKIISENKGDIINVTGIGVYLIAHCEHSLFIFNRDNALRTNDRNVQMVIPDAFEIDYSEIFTSDKGYAGLQHHNEWISSNYGYIFYDSDAHKIYRYDNNNLEDITSGFRNVFKNHINNVQFAIDERNLRCIVSGTIGYGAYTQAVTISYSFYNKFWISTHSYWYDYIFNTKNNVYFLNNKTVNTFSKTKYNEYNNTGRYVSHFADEFDIFTDKIYSYIEVIFNPKDTDRILNSIKYIINKEGVETYSGDKLLIYTNCCYSDYIDISKGRTGYPDYKSPYFKYGAWLFNWFRNKIRHIKNPPIIDRTTGFRFFNMEVSDTVDNKLIIGKYFVIRFIFRDDTRKININDIEIR